jgi:N-acetylneuraminic acid mutarotase
MDFGGRDYEWEKISPKGLKKPGQIAYHSMTLIDDHNCMLIGGSNLGVDNPHIYELDLHTMTWTISGNTKPGELYSIDEHTAILCDGKIYVFGGNINGYKSNLMFVYDVKTKKWTKIEDKNAPAERSSHSAVLKGDKMYVFGGKDYENNKLGDFWVYDCTKNEWSELKSEDDDGPISRSGHSTGIFKNYVIVYGGIHELTQELSDMYLYDLNSNKWMMVFEEEHSPVHKQQMEHNSSFSQSSKYTSF